jgi:hypothetical protein
MINSLDLTLDFHVSPLEAIALTNQQIQQASDEAMSITESEQKWQIYLNNLALFGFTEWLNQRDSELNLKQDEVKHIGNAVSQLKIGDFNICLLTQGVLDDEVITLPQTAIAELAFPITPQISSNIAHFYILVTVDEEQEEIYLNGLMRYDQLQSYQKSGQLILQSDQTYEIPLSYFDSDINHLLLYLRSLEPSAIQLPTSVVESNTLIDRLKEPIINVSKWLQGQLDEVSEGLSWLLLPHPELATESFRRMPDLTVLINQLETKGVSIPTKNIAIGYLPFKIEQLEVQIYALTWLLENSNEWSLLLIVGTSNHQPLPLGFKLEIRDANQILSEQVISSSSNQDYLYTQVIGESNDQLSASISVNNEESQTLTFAYFS